MTRPDFTTEEIKVLEGALRQHHTYTLDALASCIQHGHTDWEKKHLKTRSLIHKIVRSLGGEIEDSYRMKQLLKFKKKKLEEDYQ